MEYVKEFEISDENYEKLCWGEGGVEVEMELASETFKEMDGVYRSKDWANEHFSYDSDYEIIDDHGGAIVSFD
jgi:hypothetical protein